jgi:hypothetical protein
MSKNVRRVGGNMMVRRFAYFHHGKTELWGLLEAVDSKDARRHLGSSAFDIKQTWLSMEEEEAQIVDRDRRWEIVASVLNLR